MPYLSIRSRLFGVEIRILNVKYFECKFIDAIYLA